MRTAHLGKEEIGLGGFLPKNCPKQTLNTEQPQGEKKQNKTFHQLTKTSKTCYREEEPGKNVTFSSLSPYILTLSKTSQMLAKRM